MCIARIHFTHSCKHRWLRILTGTVVTIPNDGSRYARLDCLNDELRNFDLRIWKNVKSLQKPETHLNNLACLHSKINFVFLVFKRSLNFSPNKTFCTGQLPALGNFLLKLFCCWGYELCFRLESKRNLTAIFRLSISNVVYWIFIISSSFSFVRAHTHRRRVEPLHRPML